MRLLASLICCAALLGLPGCGKSSSGGEGAGDLQILASNSLKDLEFLQPNMEAAVGRKIHIEYTGTVEMADRLRTSGAIAADLAWPASGFYLKLNVPQRIVASDKIMASPVVFALKKPRAEDLGWIHHQPSWDEIAHAVAHEDLALGTTSPVVSDLGLVLHGRLTPTA